jgi:membrane protein DedA with SNARE-associated domain
MFGIELSEAGLFNFFGQFAYEPAQVYTFVCLFMLAASFGLPIPEELTLISVGLVANMANHPDLHPPPYPGAEGVNTITLCIVSFLAVIGSDFVVYMIGKVFGGRIIKTKFFQKQVAGAGFEKINSWFQKYGGWACGIFRFTPGLRFPGHLSCGLLGIPVWKFLAVDGLAALLSVPTQVYVVATYGRVVLDYLKEIKIYILITCTVLFLVWLGRKIYLKNVRKNSPIA